MHGRGPSKINLVIVVCSFEFEVCRFHNNFDILTMDKPIRNMMMLKAWYQNRHKIEDKKKYGFIPRHVFLSASVTLFRKTLETSGNHLSELLMRVQCCRFN